mmetsp:Transcript_18587/g.52500  ORF Transcript_18587/g.52500 Transcript_18587/m.52500 type:complete len:601 (-) Transcript_18587:54-1856(-)
MVSGQEGSGFWVDHTFEHEHEYNYVEMLVLILLLLLALAFETVWHRVLHAVRENAYQYGSLGQKEASEARQQKADTSGESRWHGRCKRHHVKLAEELVNRAGGEFMTLGFLAFFTFIFDSLRGFKWLVEHCPPDAVSLPTTEVDWLHLVELVHMKLFVGMVFYFLLISRVVYGAVRKIRKWEQVQLRYASGQTSSCSRVALAVDRDLTEYLVWRCYFIQRLLATEERRPSLYRAILGEFGVKRRAPNAREQVKEKIERHFNFSAYISMNVEVGVRDSIEVHQVTWFGMIILFALFALLHRFAHISLRSLTPIFIGAAFVILGTMRLTVIRHQQNIFNATCLETSSHQEGTPRLPHRGPGTPGISPCVSQTSPSVPEDVNLEPVSPFQEAEPPVASAASAPTAGRDRRLFHERYQTELIMHRFLQILLYLICYVFARTVMDFHDWTERPAMTGLLTSLFITLFALLVYFLPCHVPVFLGVMALPPYVDDGNLAAFFGVLPHRRPAPEAPSPGGAEGASTGRQSWAASSDTGGFLRAVSDSSATPAGAAAELAGLVQRLERRVQALEEEKASARRPSEGCSAWRQGLPPGALSLPVPRLAGV